MNNPREITVLVPGACYQVPIFKITDAGLEDAGKSYINFAKGDKSNSKKMRQEGYFTETLISVCGKYLSENNVGDLQNADTTEALSHLKAALDALDRRRTKREEAGTLGTHKA